MGALYLRLHVEKKTNLLTIFRRIVKHVKYSIQQTQTYNLHLAFKVAHFVVMTDEISNVRNAREVPTSTMSNINNVQCQQCPTSTMSIEQRNHAQCTFNIRRNQRSAYTAGSRYTVSRQILHIFYTFLYFVEAFLCNFKMIIMSFSLCVCLSILTLYKFKEQQ